MIRRFTLAIAFPFLMLSIARKDASSDSRCAAVVKSSLDLLSGNDSDVSDGRGGRDAAE